MVRQAADLLRASEQRLRSLPRQGRQLRPTHVAHHERVARHHQRDVLRGMPRRVEYLDLGVTHAQHVAVLHAPERIVRFGTSEDDLLGSGRRGDLATARKRSSAVRSVGARRSPGAP